MINEKALSICSSEDAMGATIKSSIYSINKLNKKCQVIPFISNLIEVDELSTLLMHGSYIIDRLRNRLKLVLKIRAILT